MDLHLHNPLNRFNDGTVKYLNLILFIFQCNAGVAAFKMFEHLQKPPTKVMLLGCGCSIESEATAQISHLFNLTQVFLSLYHDLKL